MLRLSALAYLLLSALTLCVLAPPPAQAGGTTTVIVDGSNDDWAFLPESGTPTGYFSVGPGVPPAGEGSALLLTDESADGIAIFSQELASTGLDEITSLSYWTYTDNPPQAPALQFSIDYDDTDGTVGWQGRLVFEPANTGIPVLADTWQPWNTLAGMWWASGAPGNGTCPQSTPCSWADVLTAFPNAAVHGPALGQFLVKSGSGWSGTHTTYTDAIEVTTTGGVDVLYDFESTSATVNVPALGFNGWFSDDTRADGTASMPEAAGTDLVSPTLTDDPEATAAGTVAHDDDILNQIEFLFFGPPVAPPADEHQGAVHLRIAGGVDPAKSQISHRNNPDVTLDADGFGYGHEILNSLVPTFQAQYSWLGDGTGSITASLKLGFQTTEYPGPDMSGRTGEDAWDKLLIYEPGNGNGATSDGTWHTESINFNTGKWWIVDRAVGGITIGSPLTLAEMDGSAVAIGARTVDDIWQLLVDADAGEEAILTSIQFGIGSFNAGGSVFVNQLETSFYRKGMITTFGGDPGDSTVICVPSNFDPQCESVEATLQDALDTPGLGAEDIILVDSGTYAETPTISSSVMLLGANAGVAGCDRAAPESVIEGLVTVNAPDVVIDGFSLSNPLANPNVNVSDAGDRLNLSNNRFLSSNGNHVTFLGGATSVDDVTIADNEFQGTIPTAPDGPAPASPAIVSQVNFQNDAPGAYVVRNCFLDAPVVSVAIENSRAMSDSGTRGAVISDNLFDGTAGGVNSQFGTLDGVEIESNRFTALQGPGIAGQLVDTLVLANTFQGGVTVGVQISQSVVGPSSGSSVLLNCFFENSGDGVEFSVNGSEDTNSARFNDFVDNGAGASYAGAETIDVTSNFWNAADGPSGDGSGSGDPVVGSGLDYTPFVPVPITVSTLCNPDADLAVTKVDDIPYAQAMGGDPVTYTLTVDNLGPFDATGVRVEDAPPEGLDDCTWTCAASGGAACGAASGPTPLDEFVDIPVGDTVTYEMACTFNPGSAAGGKLINVVTVTAGDQPDLVTGNNTDSEATETDPIFADGFESGSTIAWSSTVN